MIRFYSLVISSYEELFFPNLASPNTCKNRSKSSVNTETNKNIVYKNMIYFSFSKCSLKCHMETVGCHAGWLPAARDYEVVVFRIG